jgi:hypothetical protein
MRRLLKLLFLLALAGCASFEAGAPGQEANPDRILVMLRLPVPHFRPDADYAGRYGDEGATARHRIAASLAGGPGRGRAPPAGPPPATGPCRCSACIAS